MTISIRSRFTRRVAVALAAALVAIGLATLPSAAGAATTQYPDLQTVIPTNLFSIAGTQTGREFRYSHLVYNNGPGPLEIQPEYSQASGLYQGHQQLFAQDGNGNWSLAGDVRVPDSFYFHAIHGHFHFPLAAFGLYSVATGGGVGSPVALSPKNGFCISDSYIYNSTVPNAGAFVGTQGSCADPTTLRGLTVGAADDYDYRDPGQAIPIDGVPDGTYWFRAITDPNNDLVEDNEANNETDVKVTISNGTVTAGQVVHPDTTPPQITLATPADGARLAGNVTLSANTSATGASVQFLVDGNPVGSATQTSGPYTYSWNTTTVVDGVHWLAARVTDASGRTGTSTVAAVTVANNSAPPGTFGIDASVSQDGRGTVTAGPLTTAQSGDLLLAFVSSDGPTGGSQSATVSGGGLSWSLVRRANTRLGTAEVWKAVALGPVTGLNVSSTQSRSTYDQSLTVVAFAGAGGVGATSAAGAASGLPGTSVTTTKNGSWVFGVGNDWDAAAARTVGPNQTLQHQWVDTGTGDTFWAQSQSAATPSAGTVVPINDVAPSGDQWNLAAVEVVPGSVAPPPPPDTTPPTVNVTSPVGGTKVGGIVPLGATAADNVGVASVQFKVDGQALGAAVTSPPFLTQWDTRTAAPGTHTITAEARDAAGNVGVSSSVVVTVDNSAPPPAAISIDKLVSTHGRGTLAAPALTTAAAGEWVFAFLAQDGPNAVTSQRSTVTGGGLSWSLVRRSDSQAGVAEIWAAKASSKLSSATITATPAVGGFDGALTIVAFTNAAGPGAAGAAGAASGAPSIYLPGVATGSWVFAVGDDWDNAAARTPVAGQTLQHQWVDTGVGDTFWLQSTATPNTAPGLVTIQDTAPTGDRWNYAAVEITAAPGP